MTARRKLTQAETAQLWLRQKGRCNCGCGERLIAGQIDIEHQLPIALGGSNDLDNLSLWLREHHKVKTRDDVKRIAKANRQRKAHTTGRSRARKGRPMQGRGFDKTWRRRMDGTVERVA